VPPTPGPPQCVPLPRPLGVSARAAAGAAPRRLGLIEA